MHELPIEFRYSDSNCIFRRTTHWFRQMKISIVTARACRTPRGLPGRYGKEIYSSLSWRVVISAAQNPYSKTIPSGTTGFGLSSMEYSCCFHCLSLYDFCFLIIFLLMKIQIQRYSKFWKKNNQWILEASFFHSGVPVSVVSDFREKHRHLLHHTRTSLQWYK